MKRTKLFAILMAAAMLLTLCACGEKETQTPDEPGFVIPDPNPVPGKPIVEPWKCPYHNGRMCLRMIEHKE